ncbi:MAG: peptidase [Syntrophobacterales bacterium CG_4_8_14_3_um_filter_49_14]|nr:MAG: peptidase [Syntrophobacterales bacterium CG23_combo_of_CG06-09_8_20_14_all_48_27]PJC73271.1 MAG: peptidase [Syntrophobacterales bacterium CG_4_8_14_3_um_filter_49_14]
MKPLEHRQYAHCESGVVTALLSCHGLDLSEPMVFGITGGLTFAFIPFIKMTNMPLISYRMRPGAIIRGAVKNLDIRFKTMRYREKGRALAELTNLVDGGEIVGLQTSVYWLPYFPPEMRFPFNAHNLIIYGREGDEFLVSDPVFENTARIKAEDLQNARFARGILAPKGFMYYPVRINPSVDLREAIRKSIKRTARMMLNTPLPFIGVEGIYYLGRKIERLKSHQDLRYVRLFLGHIVRMQEEIGTGGGGFRFMYAAFLQEAGQLLGSMPLGEASQMMTDAGDMWRQFASACAKGCKSKTADFDVGEIAQLVRKCATQEKLVYSHLKSIKL